MNNVSGIIYAYHRFEGLNDLGSHRTCASLPFCGRYRLIDFALSSMMNAGIHGVGVVMQRDYQSLMDHLTSGRAWNMARSNEGLRLLPPYGLPDSHKGVYEGCMEALAAVSSYIEDLKSEYIVLSRGDMCVNIDLSAAIKKHLESGADVTAVCTARPQTDEHQRFVVGDDGFVSEMHCRQTVNGEGLASLETYIMKRKTLLELIDWCRGRNRLHFHKDALGHLLDLGGKIGVYVHKGYNQLIASVQDYYEANLDLLEFENWADIFPADRIVATNTRADSCAYYGENASIHHSFIADGCVIDGTVEHSIIFGGAKIETGAVLKNCIVMNDTVIGADASLSQVICDKNCVISAGMTLVGNEKLPLVVPKGTTI